MRDAAADEIGKRLSDFVVAWVGIARQQLRRRHDPAADAVGALVHLLLDPGALERVRFGGRPKPRERRDLAPAHRSDANRARAYGVTVNVHGAGAALAKTAAEPRIVQAE